jgi:hypothetical protein
MGRFIKISSIDDFQNKFIGTWAVEKYFQFVGLLTWARQTISSQPSKSTRWDAGIKGLI